MAFNSGVARGSNRVSIFRHSWAQTRAALCWLARSSKTTRFQPRQWARIVWRNASCASWVQSSVISNARSPLRILIAPWSTALGVLPADRHPHLLADRTIAVIQRRCLRDDRLVQHQDYPARAILQAAFQPPFAWRQVSGRAANSCRGRFQRRSRRAIATLMLLTEALIP